jgi:hypothetical protein
MSGKYWDMGVERILFSIKANLLESSHGSSVHVLDPSSQRATYGPPRTHIIQGKGPITNSARVHQSSEHSGSAYHIWKSGC